MAKVSQGNATTVEAKGIRVKTALSPEEELMAKVAKAMVEEAKAVEETAKPKEVVEEVIQRRSAICVA